MATPTQVRLIVAAELLKLEAKLRGFTSNQVVIADRAAIASLREARDTLTNHVDGRV